MFKRIVNIIEFLLGLLVIGGFLLLEVDAIKTAYKLGVRVFTLRKLSREVRE